MTPARPRNRFGAGARRRRSAPPASRDGFDRVFHRRESKSRSSRPAFLSWSRTSGGFLRRIALLVDELHQLVQQGLHARARHAGHDVHGLAAGLGERRALGLDILRRHGVGLVERHDLLLAREVAAIGAQLGPHGLVGSSDVVLRAVDQMQQRTAALDVAEEARAQAGAFMRALDEAGNVGHHELARAHLHHAEAGMQCRERVVGDLGPGVGGRRQEGRLAGVGQADQADIGDQLQAQPDPALLAGPALVGAARRTIGRALVVQVAVAAVTALGEHDPLADLGEVGEQRLVVLLEDLRAARQAQDDVLALGAGALAAHAVMAGLGLEVLGVAVVDQGVEAVDALDDDVAAAPAVTAVRAAELDELLAAKADAACAAVAGADEDFGLVEEFHGLDSGNEKGERRPFPLRNPVGWERLFGGQCRRRVHAHLDLALRAGAEGDHAVRRGEQGVVAADADVGARVHLGAALADQDVAGEDLLAAEALHAQALAVGIAAVARGAACLFMCHLYSPVALTQATICSILTTVRSWRWPFLRREFWRRRCLTIEATTLAPSTVGLPTRPSTISTSVNSTCAPASPGIRSISWVSSGATVYCFPPVRITAIMTAPD